MFRRLGAFYSRRIVNVNVNILLAGLLALVPTLLVVRLVEHLLAQGLAAKLHLGGKAIITGATFVADMIFDVSIYYGLHWLANHSHRPRQTERLETIAHAAIENVPFFKDATKVQLQRIVLSPLLYLIFLGGQFMLMTAFGVSPVLATFIGFLCAISVVRTLHTFWMLGEDRGRAAVLAGKICGKCGYDFTGLDPSQPCPECGAARLRTGAAAAPGSTPASTTVGGQPGEPAEATRPSPPPPQAEGGQRATIEHRPQTPARVSP